jgi:hypothetical protein
MGNGQKILCFYCLGTLIELQVFANIVIMVGSVVQAAASKRREMIVGRIILGVGSVMLGKW